MAFLPVKGQKKQLDSIAETQNGFLWFWVVHKASPPNPQGQKEEWASSPSLMNTKVPLAPPQTLVLSS